MREYGITTSQAQVWVHVCPPDAAVYYYSRVRMINILTRLKQVEIATARGYLCPLNGNRICDGGFIESLDPPTSWWNGVDWKGATKNEVGDAAERLFERCVSERLFRIPARVDRYESREDQYLGRDYASRMRGNDRSHRRPR